MAFNAKGSVTARMEIQPGPVQVVTTWDGSAYLYQLNTTEGLMKTNLWGGSLSVHNCNEPEHLNKAVKLFLAAEDMLAALQAARDLLKCCGPEANEFGLLDQVEAAITKATQ